MIKSGSTTAATTGWFMMHLMSVGSGGTPTDAEITCVGAQSLDLHRRWGFEYCPLRRDGRRVWRFACALEGPRQKKKSK